VFDEDDVTQVLLAGEWHVVYDGSFKVIKYGCPLNDVNVDGFEFSRVPPTGNLVREKITGPLTSVLAVKHRVR
jgi:hypothetical protein